MKHYENMKRTLWMLLVSVLLLTPAFIGTASAEAGGSCGATVTWSFDQGTGTLTLSGTGAMKNYEKETMPWYEYRSQIKSIVIGNGITAIGDYAFNECVITSAVIPDSVTKIGGYAFRSCGSLTALTIGSGVREIGNYAFSGCAFSSIVIPQGVKSLGNFAFNNCQKMTSITLSEGLETIGNGCFTNCKMLTKIVIPSTVKQIGSSSTIHSPFRSCANLSEIAFLSPHTMIYPDSAESIPANAVIRGAKGSQAERYALAYQRTFKDLSEPEAPEDPYSGPCGVGVTWNFDPTSGTLTIDGVGGMNHYDKETVPWYEFRTEITHVVIGDAVLSIGAYAFNECTITSIEIPDSVGQIGNYAFRSCKNLSRVTIGRGVFEIRTYAFNGCIALESIVIPGNVQKLYNWVFNGCTKLKSVTFEEGVAEIGYGTFNNCSSLEHVVFPATMEQIGVADNTNTVFSGCSKLKHVTFLSDTTVICPESGNAIPTGVTIHGYADSTAQIYAKAYGRSFDRMEAPFAYGCTSVFEITADAIRAEGSNCLPILSLVREGIEGEKTADFLAVNQAGALFVYANGKAEALCDGNGSTLVLEGSTGISIVYDDLAGLARVYVNGVLARYGSSRLLAVNVPIATADFRAVSSVSDRFAFVDGVAVTDVRAVVTAEAEFVGFQVSEDATGLRVLAGIDMLYFDKVGFEIALYCDGKLQETVTEYVRDVFRTIRADGKAVTAESLGYSYLAAITVEGIDRGKYPADADVYFAVKPFCTVGGETTYGREKRITVTYGAETGAQVYIKGIAAPFVPVLRFIATSDIHFTTRTGDGAPRFEAILSQLSALVLDESQNDGYEWLDAVLIAGDIANDGLATEIAVAEKSLAELIPDDMELVITMGNHDWINWYNIGADQCLAQFETAFGDTTKDTIIGGYHFITICVDEIAKANAAGGYGMEYSEKTVAEAKKLIEAAIADGGSHKPVFVIQHIPPAETVAGSEDSPWITIGDMLSSYPNVIVFAGHSHHSLVDEASIHQDAYTTVGTGALSEAAQVHLVEVDAYGRVRIRHYDGDAQAFVGETWRIDSYDPDEFAYRK